MRPYIPWRRFVGGLDVGFKQTKQTGKMQGRRKEDEGKTKGEPPDEVNQKRTMDLKGDQIVEAPSEPPDEVDQKRTMDLKYVLN